MHKFMNCCVCLLALTPIFFPFRSSVRRFPNNRAVMRQRQTVRPQFFVGPDGGTGRVLGNNFIIGADGTLIRILR